jgi:hypothetical protein
MVKSLVAVIAAAVCAAVVVGFVPPPVPAVAAAQSSDRSAGDSSRPAVAAGIVEVSSAGCTKAWPHYEQSCLHDSRSQNGEARVVRVIATGTPTSVSTLQGQR